MGRTAFHHLAQRSIRRARATGAGAPEEVRIGVLLRSTEAAGGHAVFRRPAASSALVASLLAAFFLLPPAAAAQPVFGAASRISAPVLIDPASPLASSLDWQVSFRPTLALETNELSFHATGVVSYDPTQSLPALSLDRFELSLFPADFLSIRLGRFPYLPGKANLLSQTDFFARIDEEALISGDLADATVPTDLLQVELYGFGAYLKLTAEPISQPILVPDPASPWFPKKDIPETLTFTFPVRQTLTLGKIIVEPTPRPPFSLANVSFSAEAGGSFAGIDAGLIYFHGHDYSPLLQGSIKFPTGLYGSYEVHLTPVYPVIDAFGLDLSTTWWRMRGWIDSSFTLQKTFLTYRLSAKTFSNETATSHYLAYTAGTSLQLDRPNATLSVEYSGGYAFSQDTALIMPLFSSILLGSAHLSFLERKFGAGWTLLVATKDWSSTQFFSLSFDPSEELDVSLSFPLFLGGPTTDFGQFRSNYQLTSSVTWRF